MKKQLLFAFGAAALLASCSNDIDAPQVSQDGQLQVNATIDQAKTRATDTQWAVNDKIGVSDDQGSNNVAYVTTAGTGKDFTAVGDGIVLKGNETYTFNAYYPYASDLAESGDIEFDVVDAQKAQVSLPTIDFMFAPDVTATRKNPEINLQFAHKMAKLAFTFTSEDESISEEATISFTVDNVITAGVFNAKSGVVTPGSVKSQVKASAELDAVANVILPSFTTTPEAVTIYVTVTDGDNTDNYSGEITPALVAGNQYNYTLDIEYGKGLTIKSGNITTWNPVEGEGNLESSDKPAPEPEHQTTVGDYLLKDGSILASDSEELENKKNEVVAVVFYTKGVVSGYKNGLAIALKNAQTEAARYYTNNTFLTGLYGEDGSESPVFSTSQNNLPTDIHGYSNTQLLKDGDGLNLKDLLSSYNSANQVTGASTWYLPSYAEFEELSKVISDVQTSLSKVEGSLEAYTTFTSSEQNNNFYWTSDFFSATYNWAHPLGSTEAAAKDHRVSAGNNSKLGFFRFAIAF